MLPHARIQEQSDQFFLDRGRLDRWSPRVGNEANVEQVGCWQSAVAAAHSQVTGSISSHARTDSRHRSQIYPMIFRSSPIQVTLDCALKFSNIHWSKEILRRAYLSLGTTQPHL